MTQASAAGRRPRSWRRRLLFAALASLLSLGLLEGLARVGMRYFGPVDYRPDDLDAEMHIVAASGREPSTAQEMIHPYFGWSLDPDTNPGTTIKGRHISVNEMGFLDEQSPLQKRGADRVLIGVFGGSFAHEFALQADDRLRERLRDAQAFAGKEITLIRLAMPGTKQPQQLMILNYFLALGAEFDYVVNLDGFNDVVLPVTGNLRTHVFYAYPHEWNARMQDLVNPRDSSISYEILRLRALRQRAAQAMLASPLKWSELRRAIWKVRDQLLRRRIVELGVEFVTRRESEGRGFAIDGPKLNPATPREMVPLLVDLWRRSSWQLASLCRSHGIRYLHCLQPNQYVPGSKTLTEGELEHAFAPEHPYKSGVEEGYPALQASRAWLAEHGVRFADLTGLYVNEKVTIYRDWCCHVNGRGYDLVAEAVADELIQLSRTPGTDEFQNGDRR